MYEITKAVIESKKYELSDMLRKIDVLWVQGSITDEQKAELVNMARSNANANESLNLLAMIQDLEERVRVLEEKAENSKETSTHEPSTAEPSAPGPSAPKPHAPKPHAPEYKANKNYKKGDKVFFEGKTYICIVPDKEKCVWSPTDYPAYWELVTNEDS